MNAASKDQIQPSIWCSAAKDLIVTSLGSSRIWATIQNGSITEIFWPSTGRAQVRDLSFVISDGQRFVDVRSSDAYELSSSKPFIPLPTLVHHALGCQLELSVVCDPVREVVLVHYRFQAKDAQLYCYLTPRLAVINGSNTVNVDDFAFNLAGDDRHLHFRCDQGFQRRGVGHFDRTSCDSYTSQLDAIEWNSTEIEGDDVTAVAELRVPEGVLALGFAFREKGSETLARSSLAEGFASVMSRAEAGWQAWRKKFHAPERLTPRWFSEVEISAAVLKACEERLYPGALVASLCAPWGGTRNDLAGYHLVWPRDSAKMGFAMIALENFDDARQMATYLLATQQPDGS